MYPGLGLLFPLIPIGIAAGLRARPVIAFLAMTISLLMVALFGFMGAVHGMLDSADVRLPVLYTVAACGLTAMLGVRLISPTLLKPATATLSILSILVALELLLLPHGRRYSMARASQFEGIVIELMIFNLLAVALAFIRIFQLAIAKLLEKPD